VRRGVRRDVARYDERRSRARGQAGEELVIISPAWHDTYSPSGDIDFRLTREYTSHSPECGRAGRLGGYFFERKSGIARV